MSADDLKARLRRFATDLGSEMIFTAADRIEELETKNANLFDLAAEEHTRANGLEYALTQSRAAQASLIEARDEMEKCWKEEKSRADNAEAALTQSQAEVAAAYERAAVTLDKEATSLRADASRFRGGTEPHHYRMNFASAVIKQASAIRALANPDQTAALETIRAEARAQGMREALTQSQAEVAAAYERAAVRFPDGRQAWPPVNIRKAIRALSTTDQTTALDAIRAEAREQGMREAAAYHAMEIERLNQQIIENNAYIVREGIGCDHGGNSFCRDAQLIHSLSRTAILAAITKGGA